MDRLNAKTKKLNKVLENVDLHANNDIELNSIIAIYGHVPKYMELHKIHNNIVQPGQLVSKDVYQYIAKVYYNKKKEEQYFINRVIPNELLCFNNDNKSFVFYEKAQERTINQHGKKIIINVPITLYHIIGNELYLYFIKKFDKVLTNTQLYKAILPNNYDNSRVCMGTNNMKPNEYDLIKLMKYYSNMYWESEFTEFHMKKESIELQGCIKESFELKTHKLSIIINKCLKN